MTIIFLRPGQSTDDVSKELGGWPVIPPVPTAQGKKLANDLATELKQKFPRISKIYSSPQLKALEPAHIIAKKFKLPVEEVVHLKERNTYGLVSGLSIKEAREKYPELMERYDHQEFIPGSERYDDFVERVGYLIEWLKNNSVDGTVLCVTHGYLITTIIEEFLGKVRDTIEPGSYLVCEMNSKGVLDFKHANGISFIEQNDMIREEKTKKFKKT